MEIRSITYMLMVHDMDRARAFYTGTMGFDVGYSSPMWTELALDGAQLALHGGSSEGGTRETGVNITVADLHVACDEVPKSPTYFGRAA